MLCTKAFLLLCACCAFQLAFGAISCSDMPDNDLDCVNCYQDLADTLLKTGNNKFHLANTFFPPDQVAPVFVEVTYTFEAENTSEIGSDNSSASNSETWYWTQGSFFFYQPINVFLYRSLFFSQPGWRSTRVSLSLSEDCERPPDDFLRLLTQRVREQLILLWHCELHVTCK